MEVKCTVDFGGIEEALQQLGPKLARKALRKAVGKVGDMWVSEMQSRVPVDTGDLRDSIAAKVTTKTGKGGDVSTAKVTVGPSFDTTNRNIGDSTQQPGVYGLFVEFGTKNAKAEPFMRPTFDSTAEKAVQLLADVLRDDLEDVAKR